jgi:hypothetical protein
MDDADRQWSEDFDRRQREQTARIDNLLLELTIERILRRILNTVSPRGTVCDGGGFNSHRGEYGG